MASHSMALTSTLIEDPLSRGFSFQVNAIKTKIRTNTKWKTQHIHHHTHKQNGPVLYRGRAPHESEDTYAMMDVAHGYVHHG